jgi:hypothetical protein
MDCNFGHLTGTLYEINKHDFKIFCNGMYIPVQTGLVDVSNAFDGVDAWVSVKAKMNDGSLVLEAQRVSLSLSNKQGRLPYKD